MTTTNPKVDAYIGRINKWREESERLRTILLDSQLTEELKWGKPSYAYQGGNLAIIQGFKEYCAVMFFKGALLKDANHLLVAPGASQAGRQLRFTSVAQIIEMGPVIKAYINEAIELEKAGLQVEMKKTSDYPVPEEFQKRLDENPALKEAFESLTPGRQRGYIFYFSSAKQSSTRQARVDKNIPRIMDGLGLND